MFSLEVSDIERKKLFKKKKWCKASGILLIYNLIIFFLVMLLQVGS